MLRLILAIALLGALPLAAEEEAFHPVAAIFRSIADGLSQAAQRIESASPEAMREKILYWDTQLDQASRGLELLETYDPEIKPHTDAIQESMERLRRLAQERNIERINTERLVLAQHLRALAATLVEEAERLESNGNGSSWSSWAQSVWEWFSETYNAPESSQKP